MIAPKASGIAAAIGERKTSRRTISRNGSAISSPRSLAAIESSWIARERVAKPVWVASTGGVDLRFEDLVQMRHGLVDRRLRCRRGSRPGSAPCPDAGAAARRAAVPGRERGHLRVLRAGPGSAPGPGGRSPPAGPRSRIANGAESPKCSRSSALACEEPVPGTSSVVGSSLPSTPVPMTPSTASTIAATARTARGWRSVNGGRSGESVPADPGRSLLLLLPIRGSLAIRGRREGANRCGRLC